MLIHNQKKWSLYQSGFLTTTCHTIMSIILVLSIFNTSRHSSTKTRKQDKQTRQFSFFIYHRFPVSPVARKSGFVPSICTSHGTTTQCDCKYTASSEMTAHSPLLNGSPRRPSRQGAILVPNSRLARGNGLWRFKRAV